MADTWEALILAKQTKKEVYDALLDAMQDKNNKWMATIARYANSYDDAYNGMHGVLKAEAEKTALIWNTVFLVIDLVSLGVTKYIGAAVPINKLDPLPKSMLSFKHVEFVDRTRGHIDELMKQPINAVMAAYGGEALKSVKEQIKKQPAVSMGSPQTPKKYFLTLNDTFRDQWEDIFGELAKKKHATDGGAKIDDGAKQKAIAEAKKTVFWNAPDPDDFPRVDLAKEMERVLWALWMRTRWSMIIHTERISYKDTDAKKRTPTLAEARVWEKKGGGIASYPGVSLTDVGSGAAERLGKHLNVLIDGKPAQDFRGWVEYDSETAKFIRWGENYLARDHKSFGRDFPKNMILPWKS